MSTTHVAQHGIFRNEPFCLLSPDILGAVQGLKDGDLVCFGDWLFPGRKYARKHGKKYICRKEANTDTFISNVLKLMGINEVMPWLMKPAKEGVQRPSAVDEYYTNLISDSGQWADFQGLFEEVPQVEFYNRMSEVALTIGTSYPEPYGNAVFTKKGNGIPGFPSCISPSMMAVVMDNNHGGEMLFVSQAHRQKLDLGYDARAKSEDLESMIGSVLKIWGVLDITEGRDLGVDPVICVSDSSFTEERGTSFEQILSTVRRSDAPTNSDVWGRQLASDAFTDYVKSNAVDIVELKTDRPFVPCLLRRGS